MTKRLYIILLCLLFTYGISLAASDTIITTSIEDIEKNITIDDIELKVNYKDTTSISCWDRWIQILQIVIGLVVPISSVWLAYKMNEQNLDSARQQRKEELDNQISQKQQEWKQNKDDESRKIRIEKQAEILYLLNTLYKRCFTHTKPDQSEIIDASNQILASYPYLGPEMYGVTIAYFEIIEQICKSTSAPNQEKIEALNKELSKYIEMYNKTINM